MPLQLLVSGLYSRACVAVAFLSLRGDHLEELEEQEATIFLLDAVALFLKRKTHQSRGPVSLDQHTRTHNLQNYLIFPANSLFYQIRTDLKIDRIGTQRLVNVGESYKKHIIQFSKSRKIYIEI